LLQVKIFNATILFAVRFTFYQIFKFNFMFKQINVIITTKACDINDALRGYFREGRLEINFSKLPKIIYILIDEPFNSNYCERCLGILREKLIDCEELMIKGYVMRYHNHAHSDCVLGGLSFDTSNKCFIEIDYQITYSLHDLNL
jgi:hypothetical protein